MQTPNPLGRDRTDNDTELPELGETVNVELPWVSLPYRDGAFLTQVVLKERAPAVTQAIELYLACRSQPVYDPFFFRELTNGLWRVLQAAHPHSMWQWWEWERVYQKFNQMADEYLRKRDAA